MPTPDRRLWGVTLLRLGVGLIYLAHAYMGAAVIGMPGMVSLLQGLTGRLGWGGGAWATTLAWYVVLAHAVGGFLLVLGLWTFWSALAQVPIMAGAIIHHWPQGFFVRPGGIGFEYPLLVLVATVTLLMTGPGALAVDRERGRGR